MSDPIERRLKRIEMLLGVLVGVSAMQLIVLLGVAIRFFIPSAFTVLAILILLGFFLYFYRHSLPGWFGNLSRSIFAHLKEIEK